MGSEKWGVGGMSTGSGAGLTIVGGGWGGERKSMKPLMAVSRPCQLTVAASGADAAQRAMADPRRVLKAVGKGRSVRLPKSTLMSPSLTPLALIREGMGG